MSKYSKFWPKGGLPGILHHYVSALLMFISQAHDILPDDWMLDLMSATTANKSSKI